jgi:hypothetical protein
MIPDCDSVLVDTVLESPAPIRRVAHHAVGLRNLVDFDMSAANDRSPRMVGSGSLDEGLGLAATAVAVRREERCSIGCAGAAGDEGVTHGNKGIADRERRPSRLDGKPSRGPNWT